MYIDVDIKYRCKYGVYVYVSILNIYVSMLVY